MATDRLQAELLAIAARLVVDEGLEYGPAKQRARKLLAQHGGVEASRLPLPDNDALEAAVREHIELFCADTQPAELAQLRELALVWMRRLAAFRPHLTGAVWRGTATRQNDIHLELYGDDPKACEIALIDAGLRYDVASRPGPRGGQPVDVLGFSQPHAGLGQHVGVQLTILDHDDLRGALRPDATGRAQRGDTAAVQRLIDEIPPMNDETKPDRRRWVFGGIGLAALGAGAWFATRQQRPAEPAAPAAVDGLWTRSFDTPAGPPLAMASLRGKPLLINFWATWCAPCRREMPEIDRFHRDHVAKGWQVLGLAIDAPTPVREYLQQVKVGFLIGLAGLEGTELVRELGNERGGLPFTLAFNAKGEIVQRKLGETSYDELAGWAKSIV